MHQSTTKPPFRDKVNYGSNTPIYRVKWASNQSYLPKATSYWVQFRILIKHHGVISINVDENDKTPLLFCEFLTHGGDSHENSFREKCLRRMSQ